VIGLAALGRADALVSVYTAAVLAVVPPASEIVAGVELRFLLIATITTWEGLALLIEA